MRQLRGIKSRRPHDVALERMGWDLYATLRLPFDPLSLGHVQGSHGAINKWKIAIALAMHFNGLNFFTYPNTGFSRYGEPTYVKLGGYRGQYSEPSVHI